MRRHHKRGTARFGCLRRFCLSTHSESFGVIRWPECDCVCAGVGLSGGRGRLLTHVHRASACTLNAVGLLPVSGCGDARVAPPCPTTLCVWRNLPYLTLHDHFCLERVLRDDFSSSKRLERRRRPRRPAASSPRRSLRSRGSDERGWSLVPPRRGRADSLTTTRRCVRRCARVRMGVSVRRGSRWRGGASQSAMVR